MQIQEYQNGTAYDEMFRSEGLPRPLTELVVERLRGLRSEDLQRHQAAADVAMRNMGITFTVYGNEAGTEKVWPFDILPRIVPADEWRVVEAGLKQRIRALNLFIDDAYNEQRCFKEKVVPQELIQSATSLRQACLGHRPPGGVWIHVTGTDLVRDKDGQIYVLEDNLRCPSGVSYVMENREVMKRTFPQVFRGVAVQPVEDYSEHLLETLLNAAPPDVLQPRAVVLTPGAFNSAYYEHSYLAQQMGVELVEGSDLVVVDDYVYMRTTKGLQRVDVIYRRIDDDFLDPEAFRQDSLLGVPGLMRAYRAGNVGLANAPGAGIADDKAVYAYVPKIIEFFLGEEPILPNVPTYLCSDPEHMNYVLENLEHLVVKPTNECGGYGILMGPKASRAERDAYAERIRANPRNYVAQPMLTLSTVPTIVDGQLEARHVDLRPFILYGEEIYVLPGGLTRVALRRGSMVVNSSQGGGSKDTWVVVLASGARQTQQGLSSLSG